MVGERSSWGFASTMLTVFGSELPRQSEEAPMTRAASLPVAPPSARVVVVDDDAVFTRLVEARLRNAGYQVTRFHDGLKALDHIQSTVPDLVLADIRMPGVDGFSLVVSLRATPRTALVPVVFVTAIRDAREHRRGMRLGADDYLVKPIAPADLLDVVRTRIDRAAALRRAALRAATAADPTAWDGAPSPADPDAPDALATLQALARSGGYKLLRRLGRGVRSNVYLARELANLREVVLKIVRFARPGHDDLVRRFVREHAMLERAACPHVPALLGHGITDEFAYLALEHVPGITLRERLEAPVSPCEAFDLTVAITAALVSLHARDVVHGDLHSGNILLRKDGAAVLIDLGVAVEAGGRGAADDVYGLGLVFHELLVGAGPVPGGRVSRSVGCTGAAVVLPEDRAAFQPLIERMLARDPAERPPDARAVLAWLQDLVKVVPDPVPGDLSQASC
jgi:CheY-like chemotaxis protein